MLLRASSRRLLPACYISPEHSLFRVCSDGRSSGASTSYSSSATNSTGSRQASTSSKVGASEALLNAVKDKDLVKTLGYINGEFLPASDDTTFDVLNPATNEVLATVPCMKGNETRAAIAAGQSVWHSWSNLTARERCKIMRRWHDLVVEAEDDITTIMTLECGKPLKESKGEFQGGVASIEWFAEEARRVTGDILETVNRHQRMLVMKQPVGVVASITPWNFPMSMITRKVSPAIAVGCPVVLKPAEQTPLTALALAELSQRAGIPAGIFNVVVGNPKAIGDQILASETVRKIGFTGSTAIGKHLMSGAAATVKRVSLELGGNAPFIVCDDADLDLAATGVVTSAFRNAGQTCICANRVFVQEGIYDDFVAAVTEKVAKFKMGSGMDPDVTLGPLISQAAVERVHGHVADALAKGAIATIGGVEKPDLASPYSNGNFFSPTILSGATIDMRIFREETFGPAMPIFKFKHDSEAVQLANDTEYGLAAYFYTKDLARGFRMAEQLEYGMVGLNEVAITSEVAPFGGIKESGLGREHSKYGLDEYLNIKYVCMGLNYD